MLKWFFATKLSLTLPSINLQTSVIVSSLSRSTQSVKVTYLLVKEFKLTLFVVCEITEGYLLLAALQVHSTSEA